MGVGGGRRGVGVRGTLIRLGWGACGRLWVRDELREQTLEPLRNGRDFSHESDSGPVVL